MAIQICDDEYVISLFKSTAIFLADNWEKRFTSQTTS